MHTSSDDQLVYDYTFMMADSVGEHGATEAELAELQPKLEQAHQTFLHGKESGELGFTALPHDEATLQTILKLAGEVRQEFSALVVLGIGGSDLGARAVHQALNHSHYNLLDNQTHKLFFAGDNTDPKELADLLDVLDLEQTAFNVISKSGDTVETMSSFVYIWQRLVDELGPDQAGRHMIISTDESKGSMRAITDRLTLRSLVVPANVGGRFSVLSTVGLFPLAYTGVDIALLLNGAAEMDERLDASPIQSNPAAIYAALQYLGYTKRQQPLSVLMPYADGMRGVAQWYRQLWAESLGKKESRDGRVVNSGPTPIAAVGATDQHSQVQLYIEGPFDKLITLICIAESSRSVLIGDDFDRLSELAYLKGAELNDLILMEASSTAMALAHNGRPNGTISLPKLDEFYLGQLLYFFEVACAYSGELYGIDTYNQPGVELGKQLMYGQLGKQGYEKALEPFSHLLNPAKKYTA